MKKTTFLISMLFIMLVSCGGNKTVADYNSEIITAMELKDLKTVEELIQQLEQAFGTQSAEDHLFNLAGLYKQNGDNLGAIVIYKRVAKNTKNIDIQKKCLFMVGYSYANEFDPPQKEKAIKTLEQCLSLTTYDETDYFYQSVKSELESIRSGNTIPAFLESK